MYKITVITSLYHCSKYIESYLKFTLNIVNLEEVEILLLHNEPQYDEMRIIERYLPLNKSLKHVIISKRESLYTTWNRGCKIATGKYIAIWNVDDIRFPDSLQRQAEILDKYPEVAMPYGNYYLTAVYGDLTGKFINERDCSRLKYKLLPKYSHLVSCFPMWRKSIHDELGYFDEQFKLAADYDFQIRIARKYKLKKIEHNIGCYLSDNPNRLSKNTNLQQSELLAIELRYGIYYKNNLIYLPGALKYDLNAIFSFNQRISLISYLSVLHLKERVIALPLILLSVICLPYQLTRSIKNKIINK